MSVTDRLETEIDDTAKNMEKTYNEISERIKKLKHKLNTLEETLSQDNSAKINNRIKTLNQTIDKIGKLSDSLIAKSKKARKTLDTLERKCKANALEPTRLNAVQAWCHKTEGMAADLLCYSLGHLKHETQTKKEQ